MAKIIDTKGLIYDEIRQFLEIKIKANDEQIKKMRELLMIEETIRNNNRMNERVKNQFILKKIESQH